MVEQDDVVGRATDGDELLGQLEPVPLQNT
jgi:hypothetical protein